MNSQVVADSVRQQKVKYHVAELADFEAVQRVVNLSKPQVIIHVASPRPFVHPESVYESVNVRGTHNVLMAIGNVNTVRAYIYTSSGSVVHDGASDLIMVDESAPVLYKPKQKEPYWHSKAVAETDILHANRTINPRLVTASLRVTSIFGEDDDQIIGNMVSQAKSGKLKTQIGDGQNLNDWTYVGNVAHAHLLAMRALLKASESDTPEPPERRIEGEAFFITNDEPRPFWGFARQVGAVAGYTIPEQDVKKLPRISAWLIGLVSEWIVWLTSLGHRKAEMSRRRMCFCVINQTFKIEKAKQRLGYKPIWGIDEAIQRSVASLLSEEAKKK